MATVRDGIYLEDNPPARSQFAEGRRDPVKSVIVVHTAESGTDESGPDPKAEGVASFIKGRSRAGSYHLVGDADSIIQLVRFENEAFHDRTGSNRWAIGISLAMSAADWPTLTPARRRELVDTAGQMAAIAARWLNRRGLGTPAAELLTKDESDRSNASGFISHARRDPGRRSDPGAGFPWSDFFNAYRAHLQETPMPPIDPDLERLTLELQGLIVDRKPDALPRFGKDGDPGKETIGAAIAGWNSLIDEIAILRAEAEVAADRIRELEEAAGGPAVDPVVVEEARLWRLYADGERALAEAKRQALG